MASRRRLVFSMGHLVRRIICLLIFLGAVFSLPVAAENVRVHGKVSDEANKPVEFATVRVQGTAIGTNTDLKGDYSLTVARRDTLEIVVSCLGFKNISLYILLYSNARRVY